MRNRTQVDRPPRGRAALRVVGRLGVGLDNIDVDACRERGIEVIPATGANALAVAEYVIGTAMLLLRGAYASTAAVARGEWPRPALSNGRELAGKTLGVVGFGGIGRLAGRLARALGMRVVGFDAQIAPTSAVWAAKRRGAAALDALLAEADVVTLHVPLVAATRHLIDAPRLARMKAGAILINTSRGGVVDEAASPPRCERHDWAAPRSTCSSRSRCRPDRRSPPVPNLLLTPHIAGVTARIERPRVDADRGQGGRGAARVAVSGIDAPPMTMITLDALTDLAARALERSGAKPAMAAATARALVYADAHGLASHGVSRVPQYATHLTNGRADGAAMPRVAQRRAAPRSSMRNAVSRSRRARSRWTRRSGAARESGVAFVGVTNSHHFGGGRVSPRGRSAPRRSSGSRWATRRRPWRWQEGGGRCSAPIRSRRCFRARTARRSSSTCRCRKSRAAS